MKVRRFISYVLVCVMVLATLAGGMTVSAAGTLTTDATTYTEGQDIKVTATGSGTDWVGIYNKGEVPGGGLDSIYWYYVADFNGAVSISSTTHNSTRGEYYNLPAGEYTIFLLADDGYNVISSVDITITAGDGSVVASTPNAPLSITYERTSDKTGYADGKVTVTLDTTGKEAKDLVLYFADADGKALEDYTYLQMQPVASGASTVEFELVKNTLVPKGAKKLIAYAKNSAGLSEGYAAVDLPAGLSDYDFGTPIAEFQVVSDIHILAEGVVTSDHNKDNNKHFLQMLTDIKTNSPTSSGIMIVGDITDNGKKQEYAYLEKMYNSVEGAATMYWTIGNHDFNLGAGKATTYIDRYLEYYNEFTETDIDKVYYDKWINGIHCIYLGSESNVSTDLNGNRGDINAYVSQEQFDWLKEKLAEDYKAGRPIFVFMHQAIYNTVAGSLEGQGWDGINTHGVVDGIEAEMMKLLASYPEAIYFSGHSHWELNSISTMYAGDENMCTAFNTASVGYLWTSYNNTYSGGVMYEDVINGTDDTGSQGYYIEVYSDKVLVLGRDFSSGKWMPSAMFCVEMPEATGDQTGGDETATQTTGTNGDSATEKKGCKSVVMSGAAIVVLMTTVAVLIKRKED